MKKLSNILIIIVVVTLEGMLFVISNEKTKSVKSYSISRDKDIITVNSQNGDQTYVDQNVFLKFKKVDEILTTNLEAEYILEILGVNPIKRDLIVVLILMDYTREGSFGTYILANNLDTNKVSEVKSFFAPIFPSDAKFSPNGKIMSFVASTGGAQCENMLVNILNTETGEIIEVVDPHKDTGYTDNQPMALIANFQWLGNNFASFTYKEFECNSEGFETIETWQYNVETGEYTLISTDEK